MKPTSKYLQTTGETHEVGADTERRTLASRNTHRRGNGVQDSEDDGGEDGQGGDLIEAERLAGDQQSRRSNDETLDQVLDDTVHDLSNAVVHSIFKLVEKKRIGYGGEMGSGEGLEQTGAPHPHTPFPFFPV